MHLSLIKFREYLTEFAHYMLRSVALAVFCIVAAAHMLITTGLFHALPARANHETSPSAVELRTNTGSTATLAGTSQITGRVWLDLNRNSQQNNDDPGISGIQVKLLDNGGSATGMSTATASDGTYSFDNLDAGTYIIEVIKDSDMAFATQDVGSDTTDSDVNTGTGRTGTFSVGEGETASNIDAGILSVFQIGDRVWLDEDQDGKQDAEETTGVSGIELKLVYTNKTPHLNPATGQQYTTFSDASGKYTFRDVLPGYFAIQVVLPPYMQFTVGNASGVNGAQDSDVKDGADQITAHVYESNDNNRDRDAGVRPAAMSEKIWQDLNSNNQRDNGEPGVQNVDVTLTSPGPDGVIGGNDDVQYAQVTTASDGTYSFPAVVPGYYFLKIDLPGGMTFVQPNVGAEDVDSDVDPTTGNTPLFLLSSQQNLMDVSAGVVPGEVTTASIGDRVWLDLNGNNLQDGGEPGVANVTVNLLNSSGDPTGQSTTTPANGSYSFFGLTPATYIIEFVPPQGMDFVAKDSGDDALDSDADPTTGRTAAQSFGVGSDTTIDAGIVATDEPTATPTNTPVTPTATPITPEPSETITPTPTPTGTLPATSEPTGTVEPTPTTGGTPMPTDTQMPEATSTPVPGATFTPAPTATSTPTTAPDTATLGDTVWLDLNFDGLQNDGEPGVANITITLLNAQGVATGQQEITDANGHYRFGGLMDVNYLLEFGAPVGVTFVTPNAGDDALDSDADAVTGRTSLLILPLGTDTTTVDAGITPGVITGAVHNDLNGNGVRDANEPGVSGVTLTLSDGQSTSTDANGTYRFVVMPGSYTITQTDLDKFESVADSDGDNDNLIQAVVRSGETLISQDFLDKGPDVVGTQLDKNLLLPVIRTN